MRIDDDTATINLRHVITFCEEQRGLFERLGVRRAFRNCSLPDMVRRALRNPRQAVHVAGKLLTTLSA